MCTGNCNCGCSTIVLEQQVGPQGPSGSSSSVITSNYTAQTSHASGVETVMMSQLIDSTKDLLTNNQDKLNIISWFTGGSTQDITTFRIKQNTTAVVAGANTLASITVNSKSYRVKFHIELTRLSANTFRVEGEITLYAGTVLGTNSFTGQAPVFSTVITSPSSLLSDFYIFGSIQSTTVSNQCSEDYLGVESKKYLV